MVGNRRSCGGHLSYLVPVGIQVGVGFQQAGGDKNGKRPVTFLKQGICFGINRKIAIIKGDGGGVVRQAFTIAQFADDFFQRQDGKIIVLQIIHMTTEVFRTGAGYRWGGGGNKMVLQNHRLISMLGL